MGLFETMFGEEVKGYDVQGMAAQRLGHGMEPIDWKTIIVNQLRSLQQCQQLTQCEQFLLESLTQE